MKAKLVSFKHFPHLVFGRTRNQQYRLSLLVSSYCLRIICFLQYTRRRDFFIDLFTSFFHVMGHIKLLYILNQYYQCPLLLYYYCPEGTVIFTNSSVLFFCVAYVCLKLMGENVSMFPVIIFQCYCLDSCHEKIEKDQVLRL